MLPPVCVTVQSAMVTPCESALVPLHELAMLSTGVGAAGTWLGVVVFMPRVHAASPHTQKNGVAAAAMRLPADMFVTSLSEPALLVYGRRPCSSVSIGA